MHVLSTKNNKFITGQNINGHNVVTTATHPGEETINSVDGQPVYSESQVLSMLKGEKNGFDNSSNEEDCNNQGSSSTSQSSDQSSSNSSQYSPNELPQTEENNTGSKATVAGIASATMGLGLAAFDMAKRHKDSTRGVYDSIMGSTFTSLGKNLK